MLNGIDKTVRYRKVVPLENCTTKSLYKGINMVLRDYNKANMQAKVICCNNEFRTLMDEVANKMDTDVDTEVEANK